MSVADEPTEWIPVEVHRVRITASEEIMYYNIGYLKNPTFDMHFDLSQPPHLVGKTLMWCADRLPEHTLAVDSHSIIKNCLVLFLDRVSSSGRRLVRAMDRCKRSGGECERCSHA